MSGFRWSLAALVVFGSLIGIALGLFVLIVVLGLIDRQSEGALIYWLLSASVILFAGPWLLIVLWCYLDAERRHMHAVLWAALVFLLGFPVGPLLYLVLRQPTEGPNGSSKTGLVAPLEPPRG